MLKLDRNLNQTRALLQTTEGKDERNIVFMRKPQRPSQHETKNVETYIYQDTPLIKVELGGTGKIENKTQDEDKQNKKDNTEIQKDDQHGPHQTIGSGIGAREG